MIALGYWLMGYSYDPLWGLMYSGRIGKVRAVTAFIAACLLIGVGIILGFLSVPTSR
jgi:hypothetical protein